MLVFGGIACVAILSIGRGVPTLRLWLDGQQSAAASRAQRIADMKVAVASSRELADSLATRSRLLSALKQRAFAGWTSNVVAASVADYVSDLADSTDVNLSELQVTPDSSPDRTIRNVRLSGSLSGALGDVLKMISTLESGEKLFKVTAMTITTPNVASNASESDSLSIRFTLRTLAVSEGGR